MNFIQAVILGIIQGLTEFLPISSSAHLVLVPYLFGWVFPKDQVFPFGVLVQIGTLVAVIVYFWKDLWSILIAFIQGLLQRRPFENPNARMGWYLILATIPAGILGLAIKKVVEAAFNSPAATAAFLFVTAILLFIGERFGKRTRALDTLSWIDAIWFGIFQAISIFPGISRSGSTISGGMLRGMERPSAARFSFLMSIPVMLAAGVLELGEVLRSPGLSAFLPFILVGFISAALVGYLSIRWLLSMLSKRSLYPFAIYCALVGTIALLVTLIQYPMQANAIPSIPTPLLWQVQATPSLRWLGGQMNSCANQQNGIGIILSERSAASMSLQEADCILQWGAPSKTSGIASIMETEELVLIVHPSNPIQQFTLEQVRHLFSSSLNTWKDLDPLSPILEPVQLWVYPDGDDIQQIFNDLLGGQFQADSSANLAPDPQSVRDSVASNPAALGYIPRHWLDNSVRSIKVSDTDPTVLRQPILALTKAEPTDQMRNWLICLQTSIQ